MVVIRQFVNYLEAVVPPQRVGVFDKGKSDLAVVVATDEEAQGILEDLL